MHAIRPVLFALAASVALVGCDASKEELDKTKASLATLTAERDSLKTQLATVQSQATQLQQQVTDLTAKAAAAAAAVPAAAAAVAAPVVEAAHHAAHHAAAAVKETPTAKAVEVKETKGGSSNRE